MFKRVPMSFERARVTRRGFLVLGVAGIVAVLNGVTGLAGGRSKLRRPSQRGSTLERQLRKLAKRPPKRSDASGVVERPPRYVRDSKRRQEWKKFLKHFSPVPDEKWIPP
ncbi:MAG: hypothetical protein ACE5JP_18480 [Candidatus Bipolaricaulia bacterium]